MHINVIVFAEESNSRGSSSCSSYRFHQKVSLVQNVRNRNSLVTLLLLRDQVIVMDT